MAFNPDEPRDARGRWTSDGTMPAASGWRAKPLQDKSPAGRARVLVMHALLSAPARFRRVPGWSDADSGNQLEALIDSWNEEAQLGDSIFRDRFLGSDVSLSTTRDLRAAARGAATAQTVGDMADASDNLAAVMRAIGADNWPSLLQVAVAKAGSYDAGDLPSKSTSPGQAASAAPKPADSQSMQATSTGGAGLKVIDLSKLDNNFAKLFRQSFPKGHSQEHGATLVIDRDSRVGMLNSGAGLNPNSRNFDPDLKIPDGEKVYGVFHTHPYDKSEGGYTGVSLSGGDAAYLISGGQQVIVAQSGVMQFMFARTAATPSHVDFAQLNDTANARTQELVKQGIAFSDATRQVAAEIAAQNGLLYYEGERGVFKRR